MIILQYEFIRATATFYILSISYLLNIYMPVSRLNLVKCDNSSDEMKENANSSNINGNLNDISSTYLTTHQSNSAFQSANIHKRQLEQEQWQQNKLRKLNIKQIQDFIMPIYDKPLVGQSALISDSYNSSSSTTTFLHSSSSSSSQPPLSNIVTSYQLSDHAHTSSSNCTPIAEWISPYLSMFKLLTTGEQINPLPWTACNINFSNNLIIDGAQGRIYYGYLDVGRLEQLVGHADISKEQLVVFKNFKIPPKYADNSELQAKYLANFHHEIVCSLSVNSPYSTVNAPHMVRSYGFTLDPSTTPLDGLYLVMKYYPEGTVHDLIHSNPSSLSFKDRLSLALDMVYGVNELHTAGLVHQDIKPSQFLCYRTNDGVAHACLADLGSTYPMNEAGVVLDSGLPLYLTHLYTAPETAVSEQQKHHSIQTDYLQLSLSLIFFLLNQDDLNKHYAPSVSLAARAAAADAHARVNDLGSIDVKKRNQFRLRSLQMAIITAMECHSQPHRMDAIDLMLLPTSSSSNVQPTITRQMLLEAARRVPILALDVESAARITDSANHMLKELSVYLRLADQPSFTRDRLLSIVVIQDTELQQDSSAALNKQVNCVLIQLHPATGLLTMVCPVLVGLYKLDAATRFKLLNTLISGYNLDPVATFSSGLRSVCIRKDSCEFMMQAYVELDLTGRWCWEPQALVAPFTLFILATERIRADVRAVCNGRIVLCSDEEMKEYFERQCQAVGEEKMQRLFEGAALVTMHEPITANEIDEAVLKLKEMMGEHLFSEEQIRKALQQHGTVEETLNALLEFAQESGMAD